MMVLDTHVWIRWVDPANMSLPVEMVERIETSDQFKFPVKGWTERQNPKSLGTD